MPFYDSRPAAGWPKGGPNDLNYPLLAGLSGTVAAILMASGVWCLWTVDRGLGYSRKPYGNKRPEEMNSLSGLINIICGAMYAAKAFDFAEGGGTPFSLNWYWYVDYAITCPMLVLDFAYSLQMTYKLRHFLLVMTALWCAVASFVTPSRFRFGYFALGLSLFAPFAITFTNDLRQQYDEFPPKCQRWLRWASLIFFSFWPMFPILWIFSWEGTGHLQQQEYYIIHFILDIACKTVFGIFMTLFRLELEEHVEVLGLPMPKDDPAYKKKIQPMETHEEGLAHLELLGEKSASDPEAVKKLQIIHDLLLKQTAQAAEEEQNQSRRSQVPGGSKIKSLRGLNAESAEGTSVGARRSSQMKNSEPFELKMEQDVSQPPARRHSSRRLVDPQLDFDDDVAPPPARRPSSRRLVDPQPDFDDDVAPPPARRPSSRRLVDPQPDFDNDVAPPPARRPSSRQLAELQQDMDEGPPVTQVRRSRSSKSIGGGRASANANSYDAQGDYDQQYAAPPRRKPSARNIEPQRRDDYSEEEEEQAPPQPPLRKQLSRSPKSFKQDNGGGQQVDNRRPSRSPSRKELKRENSGEDFEEVVAYED